MRRKRCSNLSDMRIRFVWPALCLLVLSLHAQQSPSALVQPSVDRLAAAGSGVDLNKWKGGNTLRGEADANLASIQKDLHDTLPPLLLAWDKSPSSVAAGLPVLLNLDALYSVVLRVDLLARTNAPRDQADALDGALAALDGARRDLGDRLVTSAAANEKQVAQMQAAAKDQAAQLAAAQAAAAVPAPAPVKTKKRVAKKVAVPPPASK